MIVYPNAKINLGLNVVERRSDSYHNIETIFYPIGIQDVLSVEPSETCSDYSFSSSGITVGGDTEDNLIIKAYHLLRSEYEFPPVDISLHKQIPLGAGLGGGSADAAFTLKALNELFELRITAKKLETLAAKLGADCPFFIKNKPVYATGIGNIFSPVKISLKGYWMLLVKPDIHVSTAEAYAGITPTPSEKPLTEQIQLPIAEWKNHIKNDFEKTVFAKQSEIGKLKDKIYDLGALYASMSGSGSSVYGIFTEKPTFEGMFEGSFVACGILD
ncbi:4-diphosphocytidyl-2-C-methyl-D-erythritol kinase [uncultured Paludibacter sp.]|nr:4-diphosphocytidyl-2-C-methyl-D-erythritol kinase [uncultured Paludibacter sp.]